MKDLHPSWRRAIDAVDDVQRALGTDIRDKETGKRLDAGQAIAREMFGPDWMHTQEWAEFDAAEVCGDAFFDAAQRLINKEPAWLSF